MNNTKNRRSYEAPILEVFEFPIPLHLLVSVSAEAGFDEWEEGEEL